MEFPAKTPAELAGDLSRCEKVTLKFDEEIHTLTSLEIDWLIMGTTSLMPQKPASVDAEKRDIEPSRAQIEAAVREYENYGYEVFLPWEGTLDDEENGHFEGFKNALGAALSVPRFQPEVDFASPNEAEEYERAGLIHGSYPLPIGHYEREARNLAAVWANGNNGARTCILAALLKAASVATPQLATLVGRCSTGYR